VASSGKPAARSRFEQSADVFEPIAAAIAVKTDCSLPRVNPSYAKFPIFLVAFNFAPE
jgi:hypothetical protein